MKMRFENFLRKSFQINTESLSNRGNRNHSLNPATPLLLRIGLRLDAKPVD